MSGKIKKFSWINLDEADNGYILRFDIIKESPKGGAFDDDDRLSREIVYKDDIPGDTEAAFEKFKQLHMFNKAIRMGEAIDAPDTSMASFTSRHATEGVG